VPGWQVRQGPVDQVGEHGFDDLVGPADSGQLLWVLITLRSAH
jgi:hypothetical protein